MRAAAAGKSARVLFRVDAGPDLGMGHLSRSVALAETLRREFGAEVVFATSRPRSTRPAIIERGFECIALKRTSAPSETELESLRAGLASVMPTVTVIDTPFPISERYLRSLRRVVGGRIVVMDNLCETGRHADRVIFPNAHIDAENLPVALRANAVFGAQYFFAREPPKAKYKPGRGRARSVLISMGGSDPHRITLKLLEFLTRLAGDDPGLFRGLSIDLVIGPMFSFKRSVLSRARRLGTTVRVLQNVQDLMSRMPAHDFCVLSFGVAMYEATMTHTPALIVGHTADQGKWGRKLERLDLVLNLGHYETLVYADFAVDFSRMVRDPGLRRKLSRKAALLAGNEPGDLKTARLLLSP